MQLGLHYFSEKPRSEVVVEYFPFVTPREIKELAASSRYGMADAILQEIRKSEDAVGSLDEANIRRVLKALKLDEIAKFENTGSIFRLSVTNRGTQSEKNVKLRVKDATAYYRSNNRVAEDIDGYVSINQVNPGETHQFVVFGAIYFLSSYFEPDVRAFSDRGVIPVSFVTLKPSFLSQIMSEIVLFLLALSAVGFISWLVVVVVAMSKKTNGSAAEKKLNAKSRSSSKTRIGAKPKNKQHNVIEAFSKES